MDLLDVDAIIAQVRDALAEGDWNRAVALVEAPRPADQADLFSNLPPVRRISFCRASTWKTPPTFC